MTKLLLIGDIHGKWEQYARILHDHKGKIDRSVQVGDFGWGFSDQEAFGQSRVEQLHESMEQGDHTYIRGNHDNPEMCKHHKYCIDDVTYEGDTGIMFVGGANSIDKHYRLLHGWDWWEDEELDYKDLQLAIDTYEQVKPRIMVTHEAPESIVPQLFPWYRKEHPSDTRVAFQHMLEIHKPELWVFGHWHTSANKVIDGTQFVCLKELETMEVDV